MQDSLGVHQATQGFYISTGTKEDFGIHAGRAAVKLRYLPVVIRRLR